MFDPVIKLLVILLMVFTPIAFGAIEVWAFSTMELGILLVLVIWSFQSLFKETELPVAPSKSGIPIVLISLFLVLVYVQSVTLPAEVVKILSPQSYSLRNALSFQATESRFSLSLVPFATYVEFFKWLT